MKLRAAALAASIMLAATAALAASAFTGVWRVTDTQGKPYDITLTEDGKATANREGEAMQGTWKEKGKGVRIVWNTGWITKIWKDGDHYKKAAFEKGKKEQKIEGSAEKVQ